MATTDTTGTKTAESGADGDTSKAAAGDGAKGTRRKLNDAQEREVTRLYAATETPVSEISKRFGIGESSVYRVAQRHGAALRGRTATSAKTTSRPAAKAVKTAKTAKTAAKTAAAGASGTRGRRGRAAGTGTAKTAAKSAKTAVKTAKTASKTAAKTTAKSAKSAAKAAAKSTRNGRRTRGAGAPAKRTSAQAVKATRAPRGTRAAGGARRAFRVSYVAVREFVAANMADAIRQAEAAGATDITGIERRA
ncbi:MAG TPA: helix-turn-helix domain-containing protein [Chloroflexota bacterium]|nr:helix-turn-helix domain-containing protein [Chloroflexota bacterium]